MEAHALSCVTTLRDESGVIGMLAMPHRTHGAGRRALLTLDEVISLDRLAERLASVLSFTSSAALARARAESADAALEAAHARIETLLALERASIERHREMSLRIAREAGVATASYSPAARLAEADLARALSGDQHVVVLAPPGTAALAWIAMAHDASPYALSPLVVVPASDAREHVAARWTHPIQGHLSFASNGSLVILDPHSLPADIQRLIAAHLSSRTPGVARIIVVLRETVDALAARGRIVDELADALGGRLIAIPGLASRTEDIRPIALDHLARLGASLQSTPLGLADDALALLLDHAWLGNEQELATVLLLAIQFATPPNVTAKDLKRSGFSPIEPRTQRTRSEPPHRRHVS
jgi:DNA-binding NtrC family response regulator